MSEQDIFGADVIGSDEDFGAFSSEIFGATVPPQQGGGPFVTVHFKDIPAVVKSQAGSIGGFMAGLLPETITAKVYEGTAKQIADGMKAKGIDAEVKVVTTAPFGGPFTSDFLIGAGVGAGAVGVGYGIFRLVKHFFFKGK